MEKSKFQIQLSFFNYEGGKQTCVFPISNSDMHKFATLVNVINKNSGKKQYNWFGEGYVLYSKWNGESFELDKEYVKMKFKDNFDYELEDIELFEEFHNNYLPSSDVDHIENIKYFKVEEIEIC